MSYHYWTAAEEAILEGHYRKSGRTGPPPTIEGRSVIATRKRAIERGWLIPLQRNFWTVREERILKENCHLGVSACLMKLPGRSWAAVQAKAKQLQLVMPMTTGYTLQDLETLIRQSHAQYAGIDEDIVKKISAQLGCNALKVKRLAVKMGLASPFPGRRKWSVAEDAIIRDNAHNIKLAAQELFKLGYVRSRNAIAARRYDLNLHLENDDCYSVKELADLMGCSLNVIYSWHRRGMLKSTKKITKYGAVAWSDSDIKAFMINNTTAWNSQKVDQYFLVNILIRT